MIKRIHRIDRIILSEFIFVWFETIWSISPKGTPLPCLTQRSFWEFPCFPCDHLYHFSFFIYHLALRLSFSPAPPFLTSFLLFLFVGLKFFVTLQAIWAHIPTLFYSLAVICNSQWRAVITQYTQEPDCHIQQRPDSLRWPWERRTAKASKQVHLLLKRQILHCRWGLFYGRDVFAKPFSKLGILGFQFLDAPK